MDPLSLAIQLATLCIENTIDPYIGQNFSLAVEAEVHQKVNENLKKLDSEFIFSAQTIFDYETREFVSTLNVKAPAGGGTPKKAVSVKIRPAPAQWEQVRIV